jgi:hypothetical protein
LRHRYKIQANVSDLLFVQSRGLRRGPSEVLARLERDDGYDGFVGLTRPRSYPAAPWQVRPYGEAPLDLGSRLTIGGASG